MRETNTPMAKRDWRIFWTVPKAFGKGEPGLRGGAGVQWNWKPKTKVRMGSLHFPHPNTPLAMSSVQT